MSVCGIHFPLSSAKGLMSFIAISSASTHPDQHARHLSIAIHAIGCPTIVDVCSFHIFSAQVPISTRYRLYPPKLPRQFVSAQTSPKAKASYIWIATTHLPISCNILPLLLPPIDHAASKPTQSSKNHENLCLSQARHSLGQRSTRGCHL